MNIGQAIAANLEQPATLERLFREQPDAFRAALSEVCAANPGNLVLQAWQERLAADAPAPTVREVESRGSLWVLAILSVLATLFAKLPTFIPFADEARYYVANSQFFVFVPLTIYLAIQRRPPWRLVSAICLGFAVFCIEANLLAVSTTDPVALARIHMSIALCGLVALGFTAGAWREAEARIDFVRFVVNLLVLSALLLGGGILVSLSSFWIFSTLGIEIFDWYVQNVVVWGLVTVPLVAAHLARGQQLAALASRIAVPFLPLVLATLVVYLFALARSTQAALAHREFLSALNSVLVGVAFISLAIVCDRTRRAHRAASDLLNLALLIVTLLINGVALWAIVMRLIGAGLWPTRLAVLGTDAVIFALFAGVTWRYAGFVRGRGTLAAVNGWIARYLPVLPIWAAVVTLFLPLDVVGWIKTQRVRFLAAPSPACLYVTHVSDVSVIDTASNEVVSTIRVHGTPRGARLSPDGAVLFLPTPNVGAERIDTSRRLSAGRDAVIEFTRSVTFGANGILYATVRALPASTYDHIVARDPSGSVWYNQVPLQNLGEIAATRDLVFVQFPDGVVVLDRELASVRARLDIPGAWWLAASADDQVVVVTAPVKDAIWLIDGESAAVRHVIPTSPLDAVSPRMVVISSDGRFAYVLAQAAIPQATSPSLVLFLLFGASPAGRVLIVDLVEGRVTGVIPTDQEITDAALSPDGTRLYLSFINAGRISVADTRVRSLVAEIPVMRRPEFLAMSSRLEGCAPGSVFSPEAASPRRPAVALARASPRA